MMLERDDNILDRIREILGSKSVSFSVLEHQVDVKVQMEYFEFTKSHPANNNFDEILDKAPTLYSDDINTHSKKELLVNLASIDRPEAYRIIERFVEDAPGELKEWAQMALQECRMLLESKLLDEQQIFISTGMGGSGSKLRYFVAFIPEKEQPFSSTQKKLIESELKLSLKNHDSEIEELNFNNNYASIVALVPLSVHVRQPFKNAIDECNSLGRFIRDSFLITNVKVMSEQEVYDIVNKPPEDQILLDEEE